LTASFKKPVEPPRDYVVPNFGEDEDMKVTKKNTENAEKTAGKKIDTKALTTLPTYPINYDVSYQKLGRDKDIIATEKSAAIAEKQLKHVWSNSAKKAEDAIPKDYPVVDLGVDHDILTTHKNLENSEKKLGKKWVLAQSKE